MRCGFYYGAFHDEASLAFSVLFSIVITSLGEEKTGICDSRAFVCLFCKR